MFENARTVTEDYAQPVLTEVMKGVSNTKSLHKIIFPPIGKLFSLPSYPRMPENIKIP